MFKPRHVTQEWHGNIRGYLRDKYSVCFTTVNDINDDSEFSVAFTISCCYSTVATSYSKSY